MTDARITAPSAPGRLGEPLDADALLTYLRALGDWRAARKQELDRLDAAALRSADADAYTADLTLAMTMWQSVTDRLEELTQEWDDGRADRRDREQMSRLIHGTAGGAGLSLVESCRLSDALTASLRSRLSFDPAAAEVAARITAARAGLERVADLLTDRRTAKPEQLPDVDVLRRRLNDLTARAARGADVSGPFGELEASVARAERDLIVAGSAHASLAADHRATVARREELEAQEERLRVTVTRAARTVTPVPRLAVPDVERLGRIPQDRVGLTAYRTRLETVAAALRYAEQAWTAPLAERDQLAGLLTALEAKASATGRNSPAARSALEAARAVLDAIPCSLTEARAAVEAYQRLTARPANQPATEAPS